jgi:hypothetical protein
MADLLIQYVVNQRGEPPTGLRVLTDGTLQRPSATNAPSTPTERLDVDRTLTWETMGHLAPEQVARLGAALESSGFFDLPPRLLINYCKEDPGAAVWQANLGGRSATVVVFDPRPRRDPVIDRLLDALKAVTA